MEETQKKSENTAPELNGQWCLDIEMQSGQTLFNELGGLRLWVTLLDQEWQVRTERYERAGEDTVWHQQLGFVVPEQEKTLERFVRAGESPVLRFRPALADRPVVIRPHNPVYLPPGASSTFYLSTIVWMQLVVGKEDRMLMELPVMVPSWTWMGRDTMEGELCYATKTYARLAAEAVPRRPWRANTAIHIVNERKSALLLERLSLPTHLLRLYQQNPEGGTNRWLWTPGVTVTCEKDLATASLNFDGKPPPEAGPCERVSEARVGLEKGQLIKAIDRIFG